MTKRGTARIARCPPLVIALTATSQCWYTRLSRGWSYGWLDWSQISKRQPADTLSECRLSDDVPRGTTVIGGDQLAVRAE